ncbi:MAG TPA: LysR substrate-binding domain-containing protein [Nocardioides sp.]|uniref:LysR substrate-binding domain-containing protein n=1 Tax=Nocardioides sp. TaxID=35761 RepID=UPI002C3B9D6C|nr:LysR substrate-binding domain-containing protein [Nocardioides sp.]HTW17647.1 LysR substrate-binding domain-containing protein [Nocardioides sp.]
MQPLSERLLEGRLKLRHLTLVTTIADHGTVIAASKALHVTQPVVTRGLQETEEILGVQLFERGPRGVTPTIFGESFIGHARSIIAQLRDAGSQIELLDRAEAGRVRVGTHLAGSNLLLPNAIASLKAERPRLTVVVREATPDLLTNALLAGEIDLMVGRLMSAAPAQLSQERLYLEPITLVARAGHPVHQRRKPRLTDLVDYPWIFPIAQTVLRAELEETFIAEGAKIPENRVECTSILTLRHLLITTDSIAALPLLISHNDPELAAIRTDLPLIPRSVGVTMPGDRQRTPAAEALLQHLRASARDLASTLA